MTDAKDEPSSDTGGSSKTANQAPSEASTTDAKDEPSSDTGESGKTAPTTPSASDLMEEYQLQYKLLKQNSRILLSNIIINGTLSIATIVLAIYTKDIAVLTQAMRDNADRQVSLMIKSTDQMNDSIKAATEQYKEAHESNEIAKRNGERQIRAYVVLDYTDTYNILEGVMHSA
jgi:hypothetical protein